MNLTKKILASAAVVGVLALGAAAPAAADPGWGHDCDCGGDWGWDGGWNPGWNGGYYGGWYPGKWINGCVTGPYGHVSICW
jgi:hypothetical protein